MNSQDFLSNEDLVKSWRDDLAKNETLRIVLQICDEESPLRDDKPATDPMVQYGMVLGYDRYARKLKELSIYPEVKQAPKRTYGVKPKQ